MLTDFKKFIARGNVVDMAVGIIIGASFGAIAKSLVDEVIMPPIGLLLGRVDFANLFILLREGAVAGPYLTLAEAREAGAVAIGYGVFINSIVTFIITAFAIFLMLRFITRAQEKARREEEAAPPPPTKKNCPFCYSEIAIEATRCAHCTSELEPTAT
jgi:large conductance mechanosensitive channel